MGLTPGQAKVRKVTAKPCAASNMIVGAPTAVIRLDGVRMAFRPVIEAQPFTLFTEEKA